VKIQKLTDVGSSPSEVEPYLVDPNWVMQQKFDGARVMLTHENNEFRWTNNGEAKLAFSAALLKIPALEADLNLMMPHLDSLRDSEGRLILDGELIIETGEYHVFDILQYPNYPLAARIPMLNLMLPSAGPVQHVQTYYGEADKRKFWESISSSGVEGAVSKHLDSTYDFGTRSKLWLKHKLVKSCECLVTEVKRTFKPNGVVSHGSASLAVIRGDGSQIPIANASLIGRELTIEEGSVVEVEYLYRQEGGHLVQPRIVRQRFDRTRADCLESQIPEYTRKVIR